MATSSIYDIRLLYTVRDRASKQLGLMNKHMRASSIAADALRIQLRNAAMVAIGFFGARSFKKHLIDFNSQLEQARITMGGMIQLNVGGNWAKNMKDATRLTRDFQQIAKVSVGTTMDFVDMSQQLTRPIVAAGGSLDDLKVITRGAVIASRAFGVEAGMAARDIEAMLMGPLTKRDRMARALITSKNIGMDTESWNAMITENPAKALKLTRKALTDPAILKMAKAQEHSFAGVVSTFQDGMQIALGKVGLPLFKTLTAEVRRWNEWMALHPEKIKQWVKSFSDGVMSVFSMLKSTAQFFIENKDLFVLLAKAKLAAAGGGLLTGFAASLAFGSGRLTSLGKSAGALMSRFGSLGVGLAALAIAAKMAASWLDKRQTASLERRADARTLQGAFREMRGGSVKGAYKSLRLMRDAGLMKGNDAAKGSRERYAELMGTPLNLVPRDAVQQQIDFARKLMKQDTKQRESAIATRAALVHGAVALNGLSRMIPLVGSDLARMTNNVINENNRLMFENLGIMKRSFFDPLHGFFTGLADNFWFFNMFDPTKSTSDKPKIDVKINRIEVKSDDPDRFVFGLSESVMDAIKNPSSASEIFHTGGRR